MNSLNVAEINECEEELDDCHNMAECINTNGNYTCQCRQGYAGDGRTCAGIHDHSQLFVETTIIEAQKFRPFIIFRYYQIQNTRSKYILC